MSNHWLTKKDLANAIRSQQVINSMIKRGELNPARVSKTGYVKCGCGEEGCGFISGIKPAP